MSLSERIDEIRAGFTRTFWVANITELFERLSYYGVNAVLAIYLHESLGFTETETGDVMGFFGGVVWFLPILGGALADRFGFRRALAFAYLVLALGYFLLGSLSASWMMPLREAIPLPTMIILILMIPALGPAIVKPCVVGTTARASTENVRSLGYSIYYTLVNIGGTAGPLVAYAIRTTIGIENVFRVCAISVFLMFFATVIFYKEPRQEGEAKVASVAQTLKNLLTVLSNFKFMLFLLIFSGFWVVFWSEFIALPLYVRRFVDPNADVDLLLSVDPFIVIVFQILVSHWTRKISPFGAMTLGLLVSSLAWLILSVYSTIIGTIIALVVLAIGEMIQSPRYYEYVSRLAPSGQQGVYMGFAFLPIAIGFVIAGSVGGRLIEHFGSVGQPHVVWWVISGWGIVATGLMWVYNSIVVKRGNA